MPCTLRLGWLCRSKLVTGALLLPFLSYSCTAAFCSHLPNTLESSSSDQLLEVPYQDIYLS